MGGKHSKNVSVLSIDVKEDVPTGKVGGILSAKGTSFLGGSGDMPPPQENFEIYMLGNTIFNTFQTVKIKTILTIIYSMSITHILFHWLLEKSEMINLQMLIQ